MRTLVSNFRTIATARWLEWLCFLFFIVLTIASLIGPLLSIELGKSYYAPVVNTALSVGTGGLVSFIFYYVVNERLERRKRDVVREGALRTYLDAKRSIAIAIIEASYKGGRLDLSTDLDTIEQVLTIEGFNKLFKEGREANEGFYAFENQMSDKTAEYDDIIFELRTMGRAFDRIIDVNCVADRIAYDLFVRLDKIVRRIERYGAGYDESKPLCTFIREIFSGWDYINGAKGIDPIEQALRKK